jgi:hypothetical protein
MGNLCSSEKLNHGFVLVVALLFLVIISLLAVSILQHSLVAAKITTNYLDQIIAFQAAERDLILSEQNLLTGNITSNIKLISQAKCGISFYQIIAIGENHGTKSKLQSTFAIVTGANHCDFNPAIKTGRQSWRSAN